MGKLKILLALILMLPCIFAQYDEYKPLQLENDTLIVTLNETGHYYIYPINPTDTPLELEIVFTNGWQLIKNIDELEKVTIPANTLEHTYPVEVKVQFPQEPFRGDTFFVEYVIYEDTSDGRIRFGPRGMFSVKFTINESSTAPEWDIVALRMSFLTLLITIMVITTVVVANKYFFTEEKEENNK